MKVVTICPSDTPYKCDAEIEGHEQCPQQGRYWIAPGYSLEPIILCKEHMISLYQELGGILAGAYGASDS